MQRPNHHLALLVPGMFLVLFTTTKQDQLFPSHFDGEIWPHSTQCWIGFVSVNYFLLGHPVHHDDCRTLSSTQDTRTTNDEIQVPLQFRVSSCILEVIANQLLQDL